QPSWRAAYSPACLRRCAAVLACFESACVDTVCFGSCFKAFSVAWLRLRDGPRRPLLCPAWYALAAERRVRSEVRPFLGGGNGTPARLAFDSPMAMACLVERAPCLPSRTCSISSCTNSPAAVVALLPSRRSAFAFCLVFGSGMTSPSQRASG